MSMSVTVINQIALNVFCILVLVIILRGHMVRVSISLDQRIFQILALSTLILMATDSFLLVIDGKEGSIIHYLLQVVTVIYYIFNTVVISIWILYSDYTLFHRRERLSRRIIILGLVNFFFAVPVVASTWGGYIFQVGHDNVYSRGPLFLFYAAGWYTLLFYSLGAILWNRKKVDRNTCLALIYFVIPPLVASLLQLVIYGVTIMWPALTLSILIVYINIQNSLMTLDYLTGIYNRAQIESIIERRISSRRGMFALIMIDLDDFKSINDSFGHLVGDQALGNTARLIQESLRSGDTVARYAGDEFLVLLETSDPDGLKKAVERIHQNVETWNRKENEVYELSLSMGYDLFPEDESCSLDSALDRVDMLMYEDKKRRKEGRG